MKGTEWSYRQVVVSVAVACALAVAGCASSKKEESSDEPATESEQGTESEKGDKGERGRMEVRKKVHFEEILGEPVQGKTPSGCVGDWDPLENVSYPGKGYSCSKFNGPDEWENIPVTMVVQQGKLSVIVLQRFFDAAADARDAYDGFVGDLMDRCKRKTGFERSIVLDCEDYVVDVRWDPGHHQATLKIIYASEWKILKQAR